MKNAYTKFQILYDLFLYLVSLYFKSVINVAFFLSAAAQQSMSGEQLTGGMSANVVDQEERKPLLSLSVILRLLAELSKSYAAVARLIVDYTVDVTSYGSGARQFLTVICFTRF